MAMVAWSQEQKDYALNLVKEGHSASAVARQYNATFCPQHPKTRNAIIGLAYRSGLSLTGTAAKRERAALYKARAIAHGRRVVKASPPKRESKQTTALKAIFACSEPLPPQHESDCARVHILDLERSHCRWPVGEPAEGMFCGDERIEGLSYCKAHSARAYAPPTPHSHRPHIHTRSGAGFQVNKGITYTIEKLEEIQTA